jgi:hypothetical protein
MRFTRWWNPSLPQTLLYSVMLLYLNAVFSVTGLMGLGIGGSAYELTPVLYTGTYTSVDQITTVQTLAVLAGALAYGFAGLGIANGQKVGWKVGVAVAAGGVALPVIAFLRGFSLGGGYILTFLFDVALFVLLWHPMSRKYQEIWFDGPSRRTGPRR